MALVAKAKKAKERHLPLGLRPAKDLGERVRQARNSKNLNQTELASKVKTHFTQISLIENGSNVEVQWYERIAHALGFRNALEMLVADGDDLTLKLFRLWKRLPDEEARKEVLKIIHDAIVSDVARDAT